MNKDLTIKTFTLPNGYTVNLGYDPYPENPIEGAESFVMCNLYHRRYVAGHADWKLRLTTDLAAEGKSFALTDESIQGWLTRAALKHGWTVLPVYLLDHGGVVYSTQCFSDRWDSGISGYIYTTPRRLQGLQLSGSVEKYLSGWVADYGKYANGEIYAVELVRKDGVVQEFCGGFYATDGAEEFVCDEWAHWAPWLSPFERIQQELLRSEGDYAKGLRFALDQLAEV